MTVNKITANFCSVVEYGRSYKFLLLLPHLYVEGRYDIDGRVLVLPIKGSGKFTGNFSEYAYIEGVLCPDDVRF